VRKEERQFPLPKGGITKAERVRALSVKGLQPDKDKERDGEHKSVLVRRWGE